ncbi:hypothetical protein Ahy_B10g102821 [Arachis hypogaea]|uniref:Major facilitator superfamily (MFS) profile domain-containing protein n=1 Tax=Arachis hypogaea TaxID=3818 RepID=A0A444X2R6_ARAHY|nr:hypothetical protein Ahy_B10g102821 [Arachis hypogaea]
MSTIASTNRKHLLSGVLLALDEEVKVEVEAKIEALTWTYKNKPLENKDAVGGSIVDMLRSPVTRIRLILMVAINFFCAVVYYGLSMNVVLNAVAEIPAYRLTAILSEKFGRKPLAIGTMCFSGLFCLLGSLLRNVRVWKLIRMLYGILGIFGMAVTYNLLFIYTAELFSTMVRNQLPMVAQQFAMCGIVGGIFAFYLPKTLNQPLYDTFSGLEAGFV